MLLWFIWHAIKCRTSYEHGQSFLWSILSPHTNPNSKLLFENFQAVFKFFKVEPANDKGSPKLKQKNFEIQFFQKISNKIVLFDSKYEFRMISAFIWYAYCPCRWKIIIFQKSACQKLENFSAKSCHFGMAFQKKLQFIGCCS